MYLMCKTIDDRDSAIYRTNRLGEAAGVIMMLLITGYVTAGIISSTGKIYAAAAVPVFAGLSAFLVVIMRARGLENTKLVTGFRQLRNFIYHPTPKEILDNYLQDQDYYYDMLLYALAFGAEEAWAISFLTLDVPEPDWYSDDIEGHAFSNLKEQLTTIDCARDLRSFMRTIENAYSDMHRHTRRSGSIR
jgi:hypothetical protein